MAIEDGDQVRAGALMHYAGPSGTATAILLVQFRPHAIAPAAQAAPFAMALLGQLRTAGWVDPSPMFAGVAVNHPPTRWLKAPPAMGRSP